MILVCGIPSETPLRLVTSGLREIGADFVLFNQRQFADCEIWFEVGSQLAGSEAVRGELRIHDRTYGISPLDG